MARRTPVWIVLPALLSLAYAIAVVVAAWRAPEKGFQAFIGQRVVYVAPGGIAERAGLHEGDVIDSIDGAPVSSTLDYAFRVLRRPAGDTVMLGIRREGARHDIPITLAPSAPPWSALAALVLASAMLVLGLFARLHRPDDPDARSFYRTTIFHTAVYVGALSWPRLAVHPVLGLTFLVALFTGPAVAHDMSMLFPHHIGTAVRRWRQIAFGLAAILGTGCAVAVAAAIASYLHGRGDRALGWVVVFVAAQCAMVPIFAAIGLVVQLRAHRVAHGARRAQLRWVLFGHAITALPLLLSVPVAISDLDRFLLVRYQPFVVAVATSWSLGYGLAVLKFRLSDVDILIKRSLGYAVTTTAAVLVYFGVVLAAGWLTGILVGDTGPLPHLVAAISAFLVFGPIRGRVTRWLDRRFFRDRRHYVEAMRRASESLAVLREPAELAREAVERVVAVVRAERAALYVQQHGGWTVAYAVGEVDAAIDTPKPPVDGVAVPVVYPGGRSESEPAWLVLGPRKSGDLYSSDDRDLLGALAGQLAVAFANARAFGRIKELSRTLQQQNLEIRELRDRLEDENRFLRSRIEAATEGATLVGDSKAIRDLNRTIDRVATSDASVLLLGESGTGKGLLARLLHATSPRAGRPGLEAGPPGSMTRGRPGLEAGPPGSMTRGRPFMQVDCGAIAASVFESELFGHERGAFTGATRMRRGPIELAEGGTLFLDEIGELPLELQPKLLRVLEERVVMRVGAIAPVAVDVRIIAATNRDLEAMVASGEFREDLYFRLRVVEITVPPLRARRADVPALCDSLMPRIARRAGRAVKPIDAEALARMMSYTWPGNVRELENVLERALVLGEASRITADDLELSGRAPPPEPIAAEASRPHDLVMDEIERCRLSAALAAAAGNQSHAAKALGIPRTTFINKLRRHGLL